MGRTDSLEKSLMLEKIEGRKRRRWQRVRCFDGITDLMDMSLSKLWELVMVMGAWRAEVHGVTKSRAQLIYCTELIIYIYIYIYQTLYIYLLLGDFVCVVSAQLYPSLWDSMDLLGSSVHGIS